MWNDPIVAETRALRAEIASEYNFDVESLGVYLSQMSVVDAKVLIQEAVRFVSDRQADKLVATKNLHSVPT